MHSQFDIPYLVLHAICAMNNGDSEDVLKSIVEK